MLLCLKHFPYYREVKLNHIQQEVGFVPCLNCSVAEQTLTLALPRLLHAYDNSEKMSLAATRHNKQNFLDTMVLIYEQAAY